ncbi:MAG: OmpH family outer membrane protein [Muribaculaceae bacterium]|nr:OmpH family outer membrane protein [Muribaculaceae bacterium]
MIKKFLLAICVAIPALVSAQTVKFGTVDVEPIITGMPEYAQANTQIQEASAKYQSEYKTLQDEMNKKMAEFQQLSQDPNTQQ